MNIDRAIKKLSVIGLCLLIASCARTSKEGITFNRVQPQGQKSIYGVKNNLTIKQDAPESLGGSSTAFGVLNATLETEVTDSQPNGNWTLLTKFTSVDMTVDGEQVEETNEFLANKSFSTTMDKDGKVLNVSGIEEIAGMDIKQMLAQMNPSMLLPPGAVAVGDTWPFEITQPTEMQDAQLTQTLKGTGTLKEVTGGQAFIEFVYTLDLSMASKEAGRLSVNGRGQGKSAVAYDLNTARFTSNKTETTMETVGQVNLGERTETIKNSLTSALQVDLVNK